MSKPLASAAPTKGEPADPAIDPEDDVEMTFFDHLGELRNRLVKALIGVIPGVVVAWMFKEQIFGFLKRPLDLACEADPNCDHIVIHVPNPTDPIVGYMLIAVIVGLILASPWVFWQLWMFIAPGLYRRERRLALPFVLVSTLFFVGGSFFGYYLVLPPAFEIFLSFLSSEIVPNFMLLDYLELSTRLLIAFGVVFEVPVIITFLSFAGIVNWKQLLGFTRWWIVISAVIAALLTPPDIGSMSMMLVPLILLYMVSIFFAWLFGPKVPAVVVAAAPDEREDDDDES
ncbi:MAG: twin-arginine translocase subunit TatC [Myxococcota bacterium]|nr:twin-arginine translocase subunit TatC [Myxococcota bacterium]